MENKSPRLVLSPAPHFVTSMDIQKTMGMVVIALLPALAGGVVFFGAHVLLVTLVSVVSAVLAEYLFRKALHREPHVQDLSAVVTGLLLALVLPPSSPLWMAAVGSAFSIIVAKELFGGLGGNFANPALVGRAVLLMSWPAYMTRWSPSLRSAVDATTSATPLGILKMGGTVADVMKSVGASSRAQLYWQMFLGNHGGSIGETSALLLLVGAAFLVATRTIDLRAPAGMIITTFVVSWLFGQDPVLAVLAGGVLLGAFFMATDYVTTPVTPMGKWVFGIGAGLMTVLIRRLGNFPEGVTYGILFMNVISPYLDKLIPRKYGYVKPVKKVTA
ncbi:MAG: RnfABCDGE type electron transport complex subunit D [Candidatus Cryosericum sp.]